MLSPVPARLPGGRFGRRAVQAQRDQPVVAVVHSLEQQPGRVPGREAEAFRWSPSAVTA